MPSKDRRVAARQGELSRRKRRTTRGPSGIPGATQPAAAPAPSANGSVATMTREAAATRATAVPPGGARSPSAGQYRQGARLRSYDTPLAYRFIRAELVRIAIFAGIGFAIIIALGLRW